MAILNHLTRSVGTIFQFVLNWIFLKFVFFITSQSKIFASDYNSYEDGIIRSDWKSAWKWNSESSWTGWWNSQANWTGWISETCWTDSRRYCQVEKSQETCCNGVFCWKKLPWNAKVRNESRIKMRKNHFRNLIKSQFFIVNWRGFFLYSNYQSGYCRNPGYPTIEEELLKAFKEAGTICDEWFETPQKGHFQRASRTDKGVSAARMVISLKFRK